MLVRARRADAPRRSCGRTRAATCRWSSAARRPRARPRDRAYRARRGADPSPIGALRSGCSAACRTRCPAPAARSAATCRASCATAPSCNWMPASPCSSVSCSSLARRLRSAMIARYCRWTRGVLVGVHPGPDHAGDQDGGRRTPRAPANAAASTTAATRARRHRRAIAEAGETRAAGPIRRRRRRSPTPACRSAGPCATPRDEGSWLASNTVFPARSTSDRPAGVATSVSSTASTRTSSESCVAPSSVSRVSSRGAGTRAAARAAHDGVLQPRLGRAHHRESGDVDDVAGDEGEGLFGLDQRGAGLVAHVDLVAHDARSRVHGEVLDEAPAGRRACAVTVPRRRTRRSICSFA